MWILFSLSACSPSQQAPLIQDSETPFAPSFQAVLNPLQSELRIDPSDPSTSKLFGGRVTQAGDLNGDGYTDVAVGAHGDGDMGYYAGAAYIYYGTATGLDPSGEHKLLAVDGDTTDYFAQALGGSGDVDGDGYDDLLVGAPGVLEGALYVFYGSSSGVSADRADKLQRSWGGSSDHFAWDVVHAGDLDADGYDDVAVSAYGAQSVSLFYGSPLGLSKGREAQLENTAGSDFGFSLAGDLDVNADGYDDLLIGDLSNASTVVGGGLATLYFGSASGLSTTSTQSFTASDLSAGDYFSVDLVGLGDVNADGYSDVAVGSSSSVSGPNSGAAYVYYGSATGLLLSGELKVTAFDGDTGHSFGGQLSGGDLDGDGYDDLVVGAVYADGVELGAGATYVYFGGRTGIVSETVVKITSSDGAENDLFGGALATVDLNQDGHAEMVSGSPYADSTSSGSGALYVFDGGCRDQDEDGICTSEGDCLDLNADAYPGATEVLGDGIDQDCDGRELCLADPDLDGFVDGVSTVLSEDTDCEDPGEAPATTPSGDCDPDSGSVYPGAKEVVADGVDQDCDGGDLCYADQDDDGFADTRTTIPSTDLDCEDSGEATATQPDGDCTDDNPEIHPDADEICDGWDNDCDGTIDVNAVDQGTWYPDVDQDGFGDALAPFQDCFAPFAYIEDGSDCDDADAEVFPGAEEVPGDGVDQDCDGADTELPPEPEGCGGCSGTGRVPGLWGLVSLGLLFRRRR
jgi:hypothetical protein